MDVVPVFTECVAGKPALVLTWLGINPKLPAIGLNSHMDVVPVFPECWTHPPFDAHKDSEGRIWARGAQDMKSVGVQHLEAVRRLKEGGRRLQRTVHIIFVPEEELGGMEGMRLFVHTNHFKELNLGFALDEGIANPGEDFPLFYGERKAFKMRVTCPGSPGHGSMFVQDSAGAKARIVIDRFLGFRDDEEARLKADPKLTLGDVTTINLTIMEGGVQVNVVPDKFDLTFDCRLHPGTNVVQFERMVRAWLAEAGPDVELTRLQLATDNKFRLTSIADDDPWYSALSAAFKKHNLEITPKIFPAATDSRYIREVGVPAIGFSPLHRTPVLLHDHNEFIYESIFLKGIDIFVDMIANLADLP